MPRIRTLLDTAARDKVVLDTAGLGYALEQAVDSLMAEFRRTPHDLMLLHKLEEASDLVTTLPFEVRLWRGQNLYYEILQTVYPEYASRTDGEAQVWLDRFRSLGDKLSVRLPHA